MLVRVFAGLLLFVFSVPDSFGQTVNQSDRTISGRMFYGNGEFSCSRCIIELWMAGVRPIATTYADLSGHFTFRNLQRGPYIIKIEIEGFEPVRHEVEVGRDGAAESNILIFLTRTPVLAAKTDPVIDVSEIFSRFPKKAVHAFKKGMESKNENKEQRALKHFEEAVSIAPNFYQARNELGLAYKRAGRFEEAEREFLKAHELNQSSADPLVNLTGLYIDEGKPDQAVTTGEQAVTKDSRSAPAFFNLGMALYKLSMLDRAETALKKALELAPKMASVRLMLANVYMRLQNREKLIEQLDTYLVENPEGEHNNTVEAMRRQLLGAAPELP